MGTAIEVPTAGDGDQVEVARDWLRQQGVDLGPDVVARPAVGSADRPRARTANGSGGRDRDADAGPRAESDTDPDADPEDVARRIVLGKLAAQARTRAELERALQKKAVPAEAATAVLDRMGEVGLVDDAAFARDWVVSRQQRRHLSRTALRRELQTKGVDRELIDDALDGVDSSDEHRAALDLARRRAATMTGLAHEVAYRRLGGVLGRRGFSPAVTSRVLAEVLDSSDKG